MRTAKIYGALKKFAYFAYPPLFFYGLGSIVPPDFSLNDSWWPNLLNGDLAVLLLCAFFFYPFPMTMAWALEYRKTSFDERLNWGGNMYVPFAMYVLTAALAYAIPYMSPNPALRELHVIFRGACAYLSPFVYAQIAVDAGVLTSGAVFLLYIFGFFFCMVIPAPAVLATSIIMDRALPNLKAAVEARRLPLWEKLSEFRRVDNPEKYPDPLLSLRAARKEPQKAESPQRIEPPQRTEPSQKAEPLQRAEPPKPMEPPQDPTC